MAIPESVKKLKRNLILLAVSGVFLYVCFIFEYSYLLKKCVYDSTYDILANAFAQKLSAGESGLSTAGTELDAMWNYIIYITTAMGLKMIAVFIGITLIATHLSKKQQKSLSMENRKLNAIADNIPGGVICCKNKENANIVYVSDGFVEMTGYTKEDIDLKFDGEFFRMVFPSDRKALEEKLHGEKSDYSVFQYRMIKSNGATIWLLDKGNLVGSGKDGLFYRVLTDITDMKHTEQALIKSKAELNLINERYRIVLDQSDYIVFDLDLISNNITYSSNYSVKFGNPPSTKNFPKCFIQDEMVNPDDISRFISFFDKVKDGGSNKDEEVRLRSRTGGYVWYSICLTTILNEKGLPIRAIGRMNDITRQRSDTQKILTKEQTDVATGLMTLNAAIVYISGIIENARGSSHAMLIVDFDSSLSKSDEVISNAVLGTLASRLSDLFRSSDIVGHIDGSKFIVFMKNCTRPLLERRADEIISMLSKYDENNTHISNIGIALYPSDAISCDDLYQKAQLALAHAANKKEIGYSVYEEI